MIKIIFKFMWDYSQNGERLKPRGTKTRTNELNQHDLYR